MNIPKKWDDVLRRLQAGGFPEAIIAGGALRDLDNGRDVKDVDIFVMHKGDDTHAMLNAAFGWKGQELEVEKQEYENCTPDLVTVYDFPPPNIEEFDDPPFQVIVMPAADPAAFAGAQLERFDIGLCRIAYNGTSLLMGEGYGRDKANRTLTILNARNEDARERSLIRAHRIQAKYADFAIVEDWR